MQRAKTVPSRPRGLHENKHSSVMIRIRAQARPRGVVADSFATRERPRRWTRHQRTVCRFLSVQLLDTRAANVSLCHLSTIHACVAAIGTYRCLSCIMFNGAARCGTSWQPTSYIMNVTERRDSRRAHLQTQRLPRLLLHSRFNGGTPCPARLGGVRTP